MTNRFGFQLVVMLGGILITSGTIATSFTTSINQMYLTYGLVAGSEAARPSRLLVCLKVKENPSLVTNEIIFYTLSLTQFQV